MARLRARPLLATLLGIAFAAAAAAIIAAVYGFGAFANAFRHVHPSWLALSAGAELLSIPAYAIAYRTLVRFDGGPSLTPGLTAQLVLAGFGPFTPVGGFALDRRVLRQVDDEETATVRVLGMGALEWALLAPAACVAAIVLLAVGDTRPMRSLLWPWALAVPAGFAIGLWISSPRPRDWLGRHLGERAERALCAVGMLVPLARHAGSCVIAWVAMAAYWVLDIAALYGAVRFIGLRLDAGEVLIAYATGYALTRRSMPLGGAAVTEVLMTYALHWIKQPVPAALAAVVVYRVFNFAMPSIPALLARHGIRELIEVEADETRRRVPRGETVTV
jgi:uncharacterized membrane protein YbhN (UPF0104 family)